jgi:hypothetical protein
VSVGSGVLVGGIGVGVGVGSGVEKTLQAGSKMLPRSSSAISPLRRRLLLKVCVDPFISNSFSFISFAKPLRAPI